MRILALSILFLPLLILAPVIVKRFLRSARREGEALRNALDRIESNVASLEPPPEIHRKADYLSEEESRNDALASVEKMGEHLENILLVILASHPQAFRSVVLFYDPNRERLWVRGAVGKETELGIDWQASIRIGGGVVGWIAKERRTVCITDLLSQKKKLEYEDGSVRARSLLVAPILNGDVFEGLLCVDSLSEGAFSSQNERLIQLIARQVLTILQYYRERKRMREQTREYSALWEISVNLGSKIDLTHRLETTVSSVRKIVDYDQCFIFLVESGERRMTVKAARGYDAGVIGQTFSLTNGLLSLIVKNRHPLVFSQPYSDGSPAKIFPDGCDIRIDPHSFLGLPMMIEERMIGVMLFTSDRENAFDLCDRRLLSIMCNHVAISIAEAQAHAQVEKLAVTDGLTGVFNHRRFQERLLEEVIRFGRHPDPFSLLMIDIDYFKRINDTYGHPAGDAVIKMIAKVLVKQVRKLDVVARYGGEEFVIMLLKTDARQAFQMAERIRKAVESSPIRWQGGKISVTISVGVASQPEDTSRRDELIAFADRALYAAKRTGRNRSVLYQNLTQDMYEVG